MPRLFVPGTTVSLLTVTSKMPCKSWSLPAIRSCPGAVFGENSICGSCYATKRVYTFPCVKNAQEARFKWAVAASVNEEIGKEFVNLLSAGILMEKRRQRRRYIKKNGCDHEFQGVFRVHDSGDLFSPGYTRLWQKICQRLPETKFWFPTRMYNTKNSKMLWKLQQLAALPNVSVRPSALYFDDAAPIIPLLNAGTTATAEGFNCPAHTQNNECRDCRACWSKDEVVSYRKH